MRIPVYIRGEGYGFGLGFGVLTNSAEAQDALSIGSYTWGGAYGTLYWAEIVFRIGSRRSWGDQLRTRSAEGGMGEVCRSADEASRLRRRRRCRRRRHRPEAPRFPAVVTRIQECDIRTHRQ